METSRNQRSILLDSGEYYFDDQFAVPFDANLKHDSIPEDTESSEEARFMGEFTESAFTDGDEAGLQMSMSDFPNEPLFSPEQSVIQVSTMSSYFNQPGMEMSTMDQRARHILNASYIHNNYQLMYDPQMQTHRIKMQQPFSNSHNRVQGGLNTWASMAAHKKSTPVSGSTQALVGPAEILQSKNLVNVEFRPPSSALLSAYAAQKALQLTCSQSGHNIYAAAAATAHLPRDFVETPVQYGSLKRSKTRDALVPEMNNPETIRKTSSFSNLSRSSFGSRTQLAAVELPKSNRLEEQAFLSSKTLPDLSFLANTTPEHTLRRRTGNSRARHGITAKLKALNAQKEAEQGHFSIVLNFKSNNSNTRRLSEPQVVGANENLSNSKGLDALGVHGAIPSSGTPQRSHSTVTGSNINLSKNRLGASDVAPSGSGDGTPLKSCLRRNSSGKEEIVNDDSRLGRTSSVPSGMNESGSSVYEPNDLHEWLLDENEPNATPEFFSGTSFHGGKKSVSFSDRIHLLALENALDDVPIPLGVRNHLFDSERDIPRKVGLYGADPSFLAEFPLDNDCVSISLAAVIGLDKMKYGDIDMRLFALANDVVLAINRLQEVHCHLTSRVHSCDSQHEAVGDSTFIPQNQKKRPVSGLLQQIALQLTVALHRLITDGLQVNGKAGASKSLGIWNLVEESSKPGCSHRTALAAVLEVKSHRPQLTSDKSKFAAFVFTCLNHKSLALWFERLCANDNLLRKFYCEDAFLRHMRAAQLQLGDAEKCNSLKLLNTELFQSLNTLPLIAFDLHLISPPTNKTTNAAASRTSAPSTGPTNRRPSRTASSRLPPSLAHKFRSGSSTAAKPSPFSNNTADYRYQKPRQRVLQGEAKEGLNVPPGGIRRSQSARVMPSNRTGNLTISNADSPPLAGVVENAEQLQMYGPSTVRMSWEKRAAAAASLLKGSS